MSDTVTAATADGSTLPPPSNPLSPTFSSTPRSPALLSLPLYPPTPPPPPPFPAFPLTPLLRRTTTALRLLTHPRRPFVTLTYAQSLDASLSYAPTVNTQPLLLSSPQSLRLTHYLRAVHSAILVGANTVLCDDPSLTCRFVEGGQSPPPIVLEGDHAEIPITVDRKAIRPGSWIVMNDHGVRTQWVGRLWTVQTWEDGGNGSGGAEGETEKERRITHLLQRGCLVLILPCSSPQSSHVSFPLLLSHMQPYFHSVMVEGGAGVITSMLQQCCVGGGGGGGGGESVVDQVVLTVAPVFVGGWRSVQSRIGETGMRLCEMTCEMCGNDVILHAFTSPPPSTLLLESTAVSSTPSLSAALSNLSSWLRCASDNLHRRFAPLVSHVLEPYNALVYSSIALPPLVLLCHALLRLHAIRRLLPSATAQRLEQWTRWRVGLLLPALLLLAHYLLQHWSTNERYNSILQEPNKRHTHEQELRTFSSSSHPAAPRSTASPLSTATPLLPPAQPYLLPFTSSSSAASRPPAPSPLPHLLAASASVSAPVASKASVVLSAIKHNRWQSSQNGSGSGSGRRKQQQLSKSGWDGGDGSSETSDGAAVEGEAKTRE